MLWLFDAVRSASICWSSDPGDWSGARYTLLISFG